MSPAASRKLRANDAASRKIDQKPQQEKHQAEAAAAFEADAKDVNVELNQKKRPCRSPRRRSSSPEPGDQAGKPSPSTKRTTRASLSRKKNAPEKQQEDVRMEEAAERNSSSVESDGETNPRQRVQPPSPKKKKAPITSLRVASHKTSSSRTRRNSLPATPKRRAGTRQQAIAAGKQSHDQQEQEKKALQQQQQQQQQQQAAATTRSAAIQIQAAVRGWLVQSAYRRSRSKIRIQAAVRGWIVRKQLRSSHAPPTPSHAATAVPQASLPEQPLPLGDGSRPRRSTAATVAPPPTKKKDDPTVFLQKRPPMPQPPLGGSSPRRSSNATAASPVVNNEEVNGQHELLPMDNEPGGIIDSDKTQAAIPEIFDYVVGVVFLVAAVTVLLLGLSVMFLEESGSVRTTIDNSFQLLHQNSISILTPIGNSFQLLYYKNVRQMPCFADHPARAAVGLHLHDDEDYWAAHCTGSVETERAPCPTRGICTRGRLVGCADAHYWRLAGYNCVLTEAARHMPCFEDQPAGVLHDDEDDRDPHCTTSRDAETKESVPCPSRGICTRGRLVGCADAHHWRLAEDNTCVLTEAAQQDMQATARVVTQRSVEVLCGSDKHHFWDASTSRPLFPLRDAYAWYEDAASSSNWLVVQRSNATTKQPPQLLVGLHPRQSLKVPLECQVTLWLWTALIPACQTLWAPQCTFWTLVVVVVVAWQWLRAAQGPGGPRSSSIPRNPQGGRSASWSPHNTRSSSQGRPRQDPLVSPRSDNNSDHDKPSVDNALDPPSYWDPIANPTVVQQHEIKHGPEYDAVVNAFQSTHANRSVDVVKVTRIQNLALWENYVAKRKTICYKYDETGHQAGDNDDEVQRKALERFERRWLWHGSNVEVLDKILQQGFNRSFGLVAAYGKGVYFARDASYSSSPAYSTPDFLSGNQYMLACRVVVGEYCVGQPNTLTPDVRDPLTQSLYDSTVDTLSNPSIYVTYHDAQAYPEYLITFKQPRSGRREKGPKSKRLRKIQLN